MWWNKWQYKFFHTVYTVVSHKWYWCSMPLWAMLQINESGLFSVLFDLYMILFYHYDVVGHVISCICLSLYFIHKQFCLQFSKSVRLSSYYILRICRECIEKGFICIACSFHLGNIEPQQSKPSKVYQQYLMYWSGNSINLPADLLVRL